MARQGVDRVHKAISLNLEVMDAFRKCFLEATKTVLNLRDELLHLCDLGVGSLVHAVDHFVGGSDCRFKLSNAVLGNQHASSPPLRKWWFLPFSSGGLSPLFSLSISTGFIFNIARTRGTAIARTGGRAPRGRRRCNAKATSKDRARPLLRVTMLR